MRRKWLWAVRQYGIIKLFKSNKKPVKLDGDNYWESEGEAHFHSICEKWFKNLFGFIPDEEIPFKIIFSAQIVIVKEVKRK